MLRLVSTGLILLGSCAMSDPLDRTFGPQGRTIREAIADFPSEQRDTFELVRRRCTRCHTLNEPFAAHVPAGGWRAQVRKMARKPGAAIPPADAEKIAAFLEFFFERRRDREP